jgi:hypothetical protein
MAGSKCTGSIEVYFGRPSCCSRGLAEVDRHDDVDDVKLGSWIRPKARRGKERVVESIIRRNNWSFSRSMYRVLRK